MNNQKSFISQLFVLAAVFFLFSCSTETGTVEKADASGGTLEILIVTDNSNQWSGSLGDSVKSHFGQIITTLPQGEPMFTMANLEKSGFSKMFQPHHAILVMTVDRDREEPLVETKKDLWAKPQRVIKISAPSEQQIMEEFLKYKDTFLELFREVEIERTNKTYSTALEMPIIQKLKKDCELTLQVPVGFKMAVNAQRFKWMRREPQKFSQGLIVYYEDYIDTNQFNPGYIIQKRNQMTREYIPGDRDGSYMTTSTSVIQPEFRRIDLDGNFAMETRGLWEVEGDFMGGPFVIYTLVDEARNRIVTIEGYVYAPNAKKALLLHQVDAILHTLQFVE